jgi:DNA (cytosine-5)-methyltransferase 1
MTSELCAVSLFSGCGGDSLGLERAGFHVKAFSEFQQAPIQTHLHQFPHSQLLTDPSTNKADITQIPDSVFESYKNQIHVLFAGFPCQGFSRAGAKNVSDPRNQLFRQFVRAAKLSLPDFIIGENVAGLLSMKSGPKESDPLMLSIIQKEFKDIGYELTYHLLEGTEFGVPQKRKRLLLVGWRTETVEFDLDSFWQKVFQRGAANPLPTLRSFVSSSLEGAYRIPSDCIPEEFATFALPVEQTTEPTGIPHPFIVKKTNEKLLSCTKRVSPIHSEVLDMDAPSKTIICTYDHQPRLLVGLQKPDGSAYVRCLLPDELKQIQGFPPSFEVQGNLKQKIVQIGNAVPPPFVEAIAKELRTYYES